jgi:hypothetical protein
MAGIIAVGAGGLPPSSYYDGHFAFVVDPLLSIVRGFIDGACVTATPPVEIVPFEGNPSNARLVLLDTSPGAERSFVVALQARTNAELAADPAADARRAPRLLDDLHTGDSWEVYNCYIVDFTVWPRTKVYANELPDP